MILVVKILRDFYERGYWDAIQFSYIPEFTTVEESRAYAHGFSDGKKGMYSETAYL